jgi:hypothetical protein
VLDLVELIHRSVNLTLQDTILDDKFVILAMNAVELGRVEEVGEDCVEDRGEDKCNQDFAQKTIVPQFKRGGYYLISEGLRVEFILFFLHIVKKRSAFWAKLQQNV